MRQYELYLRNPRWLGYSEDLAIMVGQQLFAGQAHYGRKEGMHAGTGMASNTKRPGGGFGASPFTNEAVCVGKARQIVVGVTQFEC